MIIQFALHQPRVYPAHIVPQSLIGAWLAHGVWYRRNNINEAGCSEPRRPVCASDMVEQREGCSICGASRSDQQVSKHLRSASSWGFLRNIYTLVLFFVLRLYNLVAFSGSPDRPRGSVPEAGHRKPSGSRLALSDFPKTVVGSQ